MSTSNPSKNARTTATSTVSQSSLFSLKSILSEHKDKFSKEGREAVRGDVSIGREQKRVSELVRCSLHLYRLSTKELLLRTHQAVKRQVLPTLAQPYPTIGTPIPPVGV
jgi:hypothetical protein